MTLTHSEARQLLQQALEMSLTAKERNELDAHLNGCSACQTYDHNLGQLHRQLKQSLPTRWPNEASTSAFLQNLDGIQGHISLRRRRQRVWAATQAVLRTSGVVALILIMGGLFSAIRPEITGAQDGTATAPLPMPSPTATPSATQTQVAALPSVLNMPEQIAGGRPVTITVCRQASTATALLPAWQESIDRFEAMYPNVTIEMAHYGYDRRTYEDLLSKNQVPTLFELYTSPGRLIEQGGIADLSSFFTTHRLDQLYNPQLLSMASRDGKVYGIPQKANAMGLAYNIPMLRAAGYDAPPKTWDELAMMAQKMTDRNRDVAGFSMLTDKDGGAVWHMTSIAYTFGFENTDIVTEENGKYKASFANGAMVGALSFLKDLRWRYDVLPRQNTDLSPTDDAFATDHAAMAMMLGDRLAWIPVLYPDTDMSKFGFAPLPAGPSGKSVSEIFGEMTVVNPNATQDQVEAAVTFTLWYQLDPDEIIRRYENRKLAIDTPDQVIGAPGLPLFTGSYQEAMTVVEKQYTNLPVDNYKLFIDASVSGATGMIDDSRFSNMDDQLQLTLDHYFGTTMASVVEKILTDPAADPAALAEEASQFFQTEYLDRYPPEW